MKKKIKTIIGLVILIIIVGICLFAFFNTRKKKITKMNTSFVNGNTGGNLYNAGLFCESDGVIYFANPRDEFKLYKMNSDLTNPEKINDDTIMYINADSNYLYYVRNNTKSDNDYSFFSYNNNSLCRIDKVKPGKALILDKDPCIYASLLGNYIYYLHYDDENATSLYKVCIDGTNRQQVMPTYIFTCSAREEAFYYNNTEKNGDLYKFSTNTDTSTLYYNCNCYRPIVDKNSNIYYMDVDNKYSLVKATPGGKPKTIIKDRVDCYNVSDTLVIYQKNDASHPGLYYKDLTKNEEPHEIKMGIFKNIHITSKYYFFTDYSSKEVYYAPVNAPENFKIFLSK
ncbi:DUF5050 domain-containing protein [Lachnobacterium bovis]|uniref:DUF5050 domain-containing protein n=1 Tax=Lachnobacterium bovis TaxID=140626 RepID=UPI0003B2F2FB|nr:DUF5050 domain-containing protein [Lachnobacterium bovis]